MASTPSFIATPKSGEWSVSLTSQTASRGGSPPAGGLIVTAGSNGSFIESITATALGTNVATVLFLFAQRNSDGGYRLIGQKTLDATSDPGAATELANVDCSDKLLPKCLFPASNTDTDKRGLRLAPSNKLYVALGTAVAAGWVINCNGGDL